MRYLNFILTVIAVCLVYQCIRGSAMPVLAQGSTGPVPVKVVNSILYPIPVKAFDPLEVELRKVSILCESVPVVVKAR